MCGGGRIRPLATLSEAKRGWKPWECAKPPGIALAALMARFAPTPDEGVRGYTEYMRYLVRARVRAEREADLLKAIDDQTLGRGSVAEGEYLRNMNDARVCPDQTARWVEICYCPTPLLEERPYWEEYFELVRVQDAHDRRKCRDANGTEAWACDQCDCTAKLEKKLKETGAAFLESLGRGESGSQDIRADLGDANDAGRTESSVTSVIDERKSL